MNKYLSKFFKIKGQLFSKNKQFKEREKSAFIIIFSPNINFRTILNLSYYLFKKGYTTRLFSFTPRHFINYLETEGCHSYFKYSFNPFFNNDIIFTDSKILSRLGDKYRLIKPITTWKQYGQNNSLPYFPYPESLLAFKEAELFTKKAPEKPYVITFFGNYRSDEYEMNDKFLKDKFGVLGRRSTIKYLFEKYGDQEIFYEKGLRKIKLRENVILKINFNVYKIHPERYKNELLSSDFFLSLPGVIMPLTHSILEAAIIGNVPILSYDRYYSGKLNKLNSFNFDSLDALEKIFDTINSMSPQEINEKRAALADFVRTYLDFNFEGKKSIYVTNENRKTLSKYIA